jgi:hypothetical protein
MTGYKHPIQNFLLQFRDQLVSEKRKLGFFFGAGTSMAVGLPGVIALTKQVGDKIDPAQKPAYEAMRKAAGADNIEMILNKLRTVRELIGESADEEFYGIKGKDGARALDVAICKTIYDIVTNIPDSKDESHSNFVNWMFQNQATRTNPIELFTANYDLLFEGAMEHKRLPYFDGFVGTIDPFLIPECVEAENTKKDHGSYIPYSWVRLWKIHGSINWFLVTDKSNKKRIIRSTRKMDGTEELMIYPSKQKYDESRRLPFLVFQDRLRRFLSGGEVLLIIAGYSFGDEHLNELISQALRANNRLAITALMFGDFSTGQRRITNDTVLKIGMEHPNLTIIGPDKGCIGGVVTEWGTDDAEKIPEWDSTNQNFNIGDFRVFSNYLKMNFGIINDMKENSHQEAQSSPKVL